MSRCTTFYEVCVETSEGESVPIGMAHTKRAKAVEEFREKKLRYPKAFVVSVWRTIGIDGSVRRRPLARVAPKLAPLDDPRPLRLI